MANTNVFVNQEDILLSLKTYEPILPFLDNGQVQQIKLKVPHPSKRPQRLEMDEMVATEDLRELTVQMPRETSSMLAFSMYETCFKKLILIAMG